MSEYLNHIGKFANATAIQDALDAGTLANPYVAMTTAGTLDFNSLQPTPPAPTTMGYWTSGAGTEASPYVFHITETDFDTSWLTEVYIGQMDNVIIEGAPANAQIYLSGGYDMFVDNYLFNVRITAQGMSDDWNGEFEDFHMTSYCCGVNNPSVMAGSGSNDTVAIIGDFTNHNYTFSFYGESAPISMTTVDPPYPEEEVGE